MSYPKEDESLTLLLPAPEDKLLSWLNEFYGKPVIINQRHILRHRDLSYVERLSIKDSLPQSLIYKLVLPPWDIEQDLHERVLIPSISNSAQLYLSAHYGALTVLFLEDLGSNTLLVNSNNNIAVRIGEDLAKLHRAYSYRTDELIQVNILPSLLPSDYEEFTIKMANKIRQWNLVSEEEKVSLITLAQLLALNLAGEPASLVHGDLYAENIILRHDKLFIIDWSYFTIIGVPLMDLATLTMSSHKNAEFTQHKNAVIEAYSFESGRDVSEIRRLLPYAEALSRLLFLNWLVERKSRGITGTTIGPVERVIQQVVKEICQRLTVL